MTPEKHAALVEAVSSVQMIAVILQGLGVCDASVDPGAVEWLGKQLEAIYEVVASAIPDRDAAAD